MEKVFFAVLTKKYHDPDSIYVLLVRLYCINIWRNSMSHTTKITCHLDFWSHNFQYQYLNSRLKSTCVFQSSPGLIFTVTICTNHLKVMKVVFKKLGPQSFCWEMNPILIFVYSFSHVH